MLVGGGFWSSGMNFVIGWQPENAEHIAFTYTMKSNGQAWLLIYITSGRGLPTY